jgi:hypothetical protein
LHKIRCDLYHVRAIVDVLGEERGRLHRRFWKPHEFKAIAKRQAELRRELGLPESRA